MTIISYMCNAPLWSAKVMRRQCRGVPAFIPYRCAAIALKSPPFMRRFRGSQENACCHRENISLAPSPPLGAK